MSSSTMIHSSAMRALVGNVFVKSGKNVFQIFLNIYIWKQTEDIQVIAVFNLIYLLSHMVFFTLLAPVVKRGYRNILHIFSLLGLAVVYLGIMYLGDRSINHLVLIPFFIGFFNSIYWITYHTVQFDLTTHANRGNFEGIRKSLRMSAGIITPALIGFLISANYFGYGYEISFFLGAILFVLGAFIGAVAPMVSRGKNFDLWGTFKRCFRVKEVRRSLATYSLTSFSFSNSIIEVLIPIILFSYLGREWEVGGAVSVFAIVSIVLSYSFGKLVKYKEYPQYVLLFGFLYAMALSGFIFSQSIVVLLLASTCVSAFANLFALPQKVISDNVLHKMDDYNEIRSEYMVIREWFQAAGWILSFSLMYYVGNIDPEGIQIIFGVMLLAVILSSVFLSRVNIHN